MLKNRSASDAGLPGDWACAVVDDMAVASQHVRKVAAVCPRMTPPLRSSRWAADA